MNYQCQNCKNTFPVPAKQTDYGFNNQNIDDFIQSPPKQFMHPGDFTVTAKVEASVCPFCRHRNIIEYVEPQEDIVSVKSVPLEECDSWIAKGYKVRELYAKTATMVLLEKPKVAEAQPQ